MTITFPSTKTTKDEIRSAIGQTVIFITSGIKTACSKCSSSGYYDGINETSLDSWCEICSGAYWLASDTNVSVTAHVRWVSADVPNRGQSGSILEGDCSITIASDALTDSQLNGVKEVIVDGRKVEIYKTMYKGIPSRDRIKIIARENSKV
jgi:hypothetical protein